MTINGVAVDIGTMNLVSARKTENGTISISKLRNAFLDLPQEHKRMLRLSKTSYIEYDNKLLVIGDAAISTANLFNKEARAAWIKNADHNMAFVVDIICVVYVHNPWPIRH